ncbi:MAG: sulfatase-like hydrolase/transferase [Parasporobacterium sp.]|nr:sulfatase-like hydrolase/transferase [Parasporobacterium sp.]
MVSLFGFGELWTFTNWGDLDLDEIIFQLSVPLEGTGNGMVWKYLVLGLLPTLLVTIAYIVLMVKLKQSKKRRICALITLGLALVAGFVVQQIAWRRLDIDTWIEGQREQKRDFVKEEYVDPKDVDLVFPEQKRNLIYIYLESMETTYADEAAGGAFQKNIIPELTKIAQENEDFSGGDSKLNGGIVYSGTGFTTGAMFAQTAGIPIKLGIGGNNMDTQSAFFPQIRTLGDILKDEGYRQVFLLGSDATFGGRRLMFRDHGNFEFRDYLYAKEKEWIPEDYRVWWGFEDEKLFEHAKETATELAAGSEPFNLTILTVDTHFEDGYVCGLCGTEYGDNQYANVMACSSKQVSEFLDWIKKQDFYDNTTVIICGDHTTMDTDFCEKVSSGYQRKTYTALINSAAQVADPGRRREFSTMDMFPTTLAAMGVTIPGEQLGLGTNLYSEEDTLTEQFGFEEMRQDLAKKSAFLQSLEVVDPEADALYARYREELANALVVENYDPFKGLVSVRVNEKESLGLSVEHVEVTYQEYGTNKKQTCVLKEDPDLPNSHIGTLDISSWKEPVGKVSVNYFTPDGKAYNNISTAYIDYEFGDKSDFTSYLKVLKEHPEYTVFIAVRGEGMAGLTDEMQEALWDLGTQWYLVGAQGMSYLAVIEDGVADEVAGYEELQKEGILKSGMSSYYMESSGQDSDGSATIQIDGQEYSTNLRGFNIVVYSKELGQVIDSAWFDTHIVEETEEQAVQY